MHTMQGKEQVAGTGHDDSNIGRFYQFLAENVIPDLARDRIERGLQGANMLKLGIVSHSSFMQSIFKHICGLEAKPLNNDILAIPYKFSISADGMPSMSIMGGTAVET